MLREVSTDQVLQRCGVWFLIWVRVSKVTCGWLDLSRQVESLTKPETEVTHRKEHMVCSLWAEVSGEKSPRGNAFRLPRDTGF